MPKVTLTFDLPEEHQEMWVALHGDRAQAGLSEIYNVARSALKYGEPSVDVYREALEEIRGLADEFGVEE